MSDKKVIFSKGNIDWTKWEKTKDMNPVDVGVHIHNCNVNYDEDNLDPDCTCAYLAKEFDGAEVTQPLLAGLSASECKDAFRFDEFSQWFLLC